MIYTIQEIFKSDTYTKIKKDVNTVDKDPKFTNDFIPSVLAVEREMIEKLDDMLIECIEMAEDMLEGKSSGKTCPIMDKLSPPSPAPPAPATKTKAPATKTTAPKVGTVTPVKVVQTNGISKQIMLI